MSQPRANDEIAGNLVFSLSDQHFFSLAIYLVLHNWNLPIN